MTRSWKVFRDDDPDLGGQLEPFDALTADGLPVLGEVHPTIINVKAVAFTGISQMGINLWKVTWLYEGLIGQGQLQLNVDQRTILIDEWRTERFGAPKGEELIIPALGIINPSNRYEDISGFHVDVRGAPTTVPRIRQVCNITEFLDTGGLAPQLPRWVVWAGLIGTRNDALFPAVPQGPPAPPGTVVYGGASSRQYRGDIIAVTHTFIIDLLFHLVQIIDRDQRGWPLLELDPATQRVTARDVFWRQPFPLLTNFHLISDFF